MGNRAQVRQSGAFSDCYICASWRLPGASRVGANATSEFFGFSVTRTHPGGHFRPGS